MQKLQGIIRFVYTCKEKELLSIAASLSYKLILSVFPFIIFLFSLVAFLDVDPQEVLAWSALLFPEETMKLIGSFVEEVVSVRSAGLLSTSLIVSIVSASSGIRAGIKGLNKSHGREDSRGFIRLTLTSIALVFLLAFAILLSLLVLVFWDWVIQLLAPFFSISFLGIFGMLNYVLTMLLLTAFITFFYWIAAERTLWWRLHLPGALFSSIVWVVSSKLFNIYVANFSRYSTLYGSIGGVFILIIWLNIVSTVLLLGGEINAVLRGKGI